jgi:hypothetical protein
MGDLLEFPSLKAQGLAYLERQLRAVLTERGADAELIDFASEQLTSLYDQVSTAESYTFRVALPTDLRPEQSQSLHTELNRGVEQLRRDNHALMIQLVAELVLTQVQLFQQQRARAPTPPE